MALVMKFSEHTAKLKLIGLETESRSAEVQGKKGLASFLAGRLGSKEGAASAPKIPEELQKLMNHSPGHPEVSEIEPGDEVFGVLFKGPDYPPDMENQGVDDE